jgi:hypothetical protein
MADNLEKLDYYRMLLTPPAGDFCRVNFTLNGLPFPESFARALLKSTIPSEFIINNLNYLHANHKKLCEGLKQNAECEFSIKDRKLFIKLNDVLIDNKETLHEFKFFHKPKDREIATRENILELLSKGYLPKLPSNQSYVKDVYGLMGLSTIENFLSGETLSPNQKSRLIEMYCCENNIKDKNIKLEDIEKSEDFFEELSMRDKFDDKVVSSMIQTLQNPVESSDAKAMRTPLWEMYLPSDISPEKTYTISHFTNHVSLTQKKELTETLEKLAEQQISKTPHKHW